MNRAIEGTEGIRRVQGRVQAGKGDASRWLALFNEAYSRKLGGAVFPGSLNLALDRAFDWFHPAYEAYIVWCGHEEYGGERDILLLPCRLQTPDQRLAWLWTTTTAVRGGGKSWVVEVVSDVRLRDAYSWVDGSMVELTLCLDPLARADCEYIRAWKKRLRDDA